MTTKKAVQEMNAKVDVFLDMHNRLRSIRERVETLQYKVRDAKAQHYSDMPRGTMHTTNPLEDYVVRQEELMHEMGAIETELKMQWNALKQHLKVCGVQQEGITLMYYRCYHGKKWKECTALMQFEYEKWNDNKSFSTYRGIAQAVQNYAAIIGENANREKVEKVV